jgi:glucosamine-6-phosphate deaminase
MQVVIVDDYGKLCERCAQLIIDAINERPALKLGLCTGQTPLGVYRLLVDRYKQGAVSFSNVTLFNVDELIGIAQDDEKSYAHYLYTNLINHVNLRLENICLIDGMDASAHDYPWRYEELIKLKGGIDLQLLGIGKDGHIGFNSPGTPLDSRTHICADGLTLGIATILEAKRIILLASGIEKAVALRGMLKGPQTSMLPASVLQSHPDTTVLCDRDAASLISYCCDSALF